MYTYQCYKNQLLVLLTLFANANSRFSAVSPCLSFYSALYTVLMTNFGGPMWLGFDQDVPLNEERFTKDEGDD
jgi:hypothetical protein